ncbi:MAG TPA: hypothetical protein VFV73_26040 [Streptosporangiaceae bacterium]|nr:hypothetical protein [Streptosporangiaceae bacterium]
MNTEERQLAEMLHRITPEPSRRVTVEDIAYRVASEGNGAGRRPDPRPRRGFSFASGAFGGNPLRPPAVGGRRWAPALAALGVVVIAGASAAVASVATSHHTQAPSANGTPTTTLSGSPSSSSPTGSVSSVPPAGPLPVAGGMWGAALLNRHSFDQESLTGSGDSLYAFGNGTLDRIDPASGNVLRSVPYNAPLPGRPVVVGNTVWVVWSYGSGDIFLRGYDASTLAQVASVEVPAIGGTVSSAQGVLAAAPDGKLYVAAGREIAIVDPASRQVTHRIFMTAGQASSVAVAPDGSKVYVGIASASSFRLLAYDSAGRIAGSSTMEGGEGGNLVATAGGVWGTAGTGMSAWVWFAPGGDLGFASRVTQGAGGGLASLPSVSGGAVWIGGSHELICASPATGKALARTTIPADHSVVEYFGSVTVLGNGHAYALYSDEHAQLAGVAQLTPPAACSGSSSGS